MTDTHDVIIVGGGPAALAAAIYSCRAELKTVLFEKTVLGGQVTKTYDVANYPGFPDGVDGVELIQRMEQQARKFGTDVKLEEVTRVELEGVTKVVTTDASTYRAPIAILATGADPRKLGAPGENELRGRGVSYCATCDGPFFKGKKVAVVGGGDSAFKEGIFLTKFAEEVALIHRSADFKAEKALQSQAKSNPKIKFVLNAAVKQIVGTDSVEGVIIKHVTTSAERELPVKGVFIFVGNVPNTGFLCNLFPVDCGGHIETDHNMETSIKGIYAIGDVRKHSYRQIATAVGEGATAAIAAEHRLSELRTKTPASPS